jgi:hypothetical protein
MREIIRPSKIQQQYFYIFPLLYPELFSSLDEMREIMYCTRVFVAKPTCEYEHCLARGYQNDAINFAIFAFCMHNAR